ncbi:hypothetical protein B0H14DRAFT_2588867 [Mycena olivaceomarginata]|nr:hypothetical protein B0H14DRAFT_2588867 [Mycena olivaceomarginata]
MAPPRRAVWVRLRLRPVATVSINMGDPYAVGSPPVGSRVDMVTEGTKGVELGRKVEVGGAMTYVGAIGAVVAGSRGRGCEGGGGGGDCCGANLTRPVRGPCAPIAAGRRPPSSWGWRSCASLPGAGGCVWRWGGGSMSIAARGGAGTGPAGGGAGSSEGRDRPFFLRNKRFTDLLVGTSDRDAALSRRGLVGIGPQLGAGDVMSLVQALAATANDVPDNHVGDHKRANIVVGGVRRRRKGVGKWYAGVADGNDGRGKGRGWWTRSPVGAVPGQSPGMPLGGRGCSIAMLEAIQPIMQTLDFGLEDIAVRPEVLRRHRGSHPREREGTDRVRAR